MWNMRDVYGNVVPGKDKRTVVSSVTNSASGGVEKEMSDHPNAPIKSLLLIFGLLFAIRFVWEIT